MDSSKTVALSGRVSEVRDRPEGESGRGGWRGGGGGGGGCGGERGREGGGSECFSHTALCIERERERIHSFVQYNT